MNLEAQIAANKTKMINDIPEGWVETTLGEVCKIKYGKDHKKLEDGNFPCYGSGGVMRNVNKILYDKPSVLIPRKGTLSNLFFINKPFWTVDTLFYTEIDETKINPKYLFYKLKTLNLADLNVGSAVPSLTTSVLNDVILEIPKNILEQDSLVQILTSFDNKISLLQEQNKTLETMAQTIFKEWFGKYQIGDVLPEGWHVGTLKDIIKTANTGLDAIKRAPIVDEETGIKCFRIQDASQKKYFNKWGNTIVEKKNFEKFKLMKGDILIARTGNSIGVNYFVQENLNAVFNNGLIRLRTNEKSNYSVLNMIITSDRFKKHIDSISYGTSTQPNMQINSLLNYEFILPPEEIQNEFEKLYELNITKQNNNHQQIQTLTKTRETLLPKLMSGELRVADALKAVE
ncbi:restriction endonuclease subunit S [Aureivirga marina]|uniref:restriction endonuclease subunit S n=1 Tax=Aureivirga marina TaxID=1182451 RepID=UPI0018C9B365|nr:restriction endonuclease subunit S [Aureivirga marina]